MNTLRNKTYKAHTTYGSTRLALALIAGALLMTPDATQAQVKGSALPVANSLSMADRVMMVTDPSGTPSTKTATLTLLKATMGSGSGDVVGPASAVNNRVVFFDGTTGKLIKDSGLTLSGTNTGDQDLSSYLTSAAAALAYQPLNTNLNLLSALTTSGAGVMKYTNDFGFTAGQLIASDLWNPLGANTIMSFNGSGNGAAITPSAVLDIIGSTRGQILYRGASGWTVLSAGTSGQALTTGGAGADPSWTTVGVSDGDKGSITVSSSGTVWTIDASAVTDSMLAGSISPSKVTGTAAILGANTFTGAQTLTGVPTIGDGTTALPLVNIRPSSGVTTVTSQEPNGTAIGVTLQDASQGNFIAFWRSNTPLGKIGYNARFAGMEMVNTGSSGFQIYTTQSAAYAEGSSVRSGLFGDVATGLRQAANYQVGWSANAAGSGDAYSIDTALVRSAAGVVGVSDGASGVGFLSGKLRLQTSAAPSSASDTGTVNEVRWDANFIYICTATNTWKRVAIATW